MGLFSRDETIYVSSVIYPLGEELDKIPDVVKASVIGAGIKGENRTKAIKKSIIDGQGIKLRQAYSYAAKSFYAGLPEGLSRVSNESDATLVRTLIEEYLKGVHAPSSVDVKSVSLEYTSNYEAILRQQIETKYNYDFYMDEVHTAVFGLPVGSVLVLTALEDDPLLHPNEEGWRLTFTKPDTTTVSFDEWYSDTLFDAEDALIQWRIFSEVSIGGAAAVTSMYTLDGPSANLNLFLRNIATNRSGTFPGIRIKRKKYYINENLFHTDLPVAADYWKTTPAYRTSKQYARRLGAAMDDLIETLAANPDEKQIDFAFIQPGTMIASPNQCAMEYHFNYFNRLRLSMPDNKPAFDAWVAKIGNTMSKDEAKRCPAQSVRIYDPNTQSSCVDMEISWRYMTYEEKAGTLTKPYEMEVEATADQQDVNFRYGRGTKKVTYDFTKLYIRKRLSPSTYAELMIRGLWHENYVFKGKSVKSGVWDAFNDPDGDFGSGFLIPLEIEVFYTLSGREQLQLAQEALHLVLNCYKVVKEKWYETGLFKIVMVIIAVVVIVISWGTLTGAVMGVYSAVSAAVGAAMIGASLTVIAAIAAVITALIVVGVVVAVQLVAKEAGEWAAEQWGPVWGAVVSVVVTIALSWGVGQLGQMYFNVPVTPMTLTQQVMNAASFVFSGLATYTQYELELIQDEYKKWNAESEEINSQIAQLEKLWEENFPDMQLPAQTWFAPIEKPNDWLIRTQSTGDALVNRLIAPIEYMSEITLTPRLQ